MALNYAKTNTFVLGTTIASSSINANFDDVVNAFGGLENLSKSLSNLYVDTTLRSSGTIQFADGVVGTPSLVFTSDTLTGLYKIATSNIGIATAGTLRLNISSTAITAALPIAMGGTNKITGLAAASANGDAVRWEQLPGPAATISDWVTYTPTVAGFTGTNTQQLMWRRIGGSLYILGWVNSTTFGATNISFTLPNSVAIDYTNLGTSASRETVGTGLLLQDGAIGAMQFFADGSDTTHIYGGNGSQASQTNAKRTASGLFGATTPTTMFINVAIPITGWTI